MGSPLVAGRFLTPRDTADAPKVVLVNETLARMLWGDANPIGRQINPGGGTSYSTVVGVVGDVRYQNPGSAPRPTFYMSAYRFAMNPMTLVVRSSLDTAEIVGLVRAQVGALDPTLPVFNVSSMDDRVRARLAPQRLTAALLAGFSTLALLLSAVGLYGTIAYATSLRTREIGIRMALGARGLDALRPLLGQCAGLIAAGIGLGLAVALPLTRLMRGLLGDVSPADPLALAGSAFVLAIAALAASYFPLRRAMRIDPALALKPE
jgi:putative ABC transport system permease protein